MDKPYPPWKYWTKSSLTDTLRNVFDGLGEKAKENIQNILNNFDCVQEITELDFFIGKDAPACSFIVTFLCQDLSKQDPDLDPISLIKETQFSILKDISIYLNTTRLKPAIKITAISSSGELASWTCWECLTEIYNEELLYEDWSLSADFNYKLK